MILTNFRLVLRNFHQAKELYSGLQSLVPAASVTGQHTCKTTTAVFSHTSPKYLHTTCDGLVRVQSLCVQQKRHIRKVYPDPFEQDPEYYLLPEEKTHLDLNHVPDLGHQGPELTTKVEEAAKGENLGRLFAVVHLGGQQRKVTTEDVVIVNGFFPPQIGDKIRLEKVMLVGGKDFTLFGRPILNRDIVRVEATVIEKTLSHIRLHYTKMKRKRTLKLYQQPQSVIVINSIEVDPSPLK
ncbi:39S ribosomal protein L21, mitochondrial-like [Mercenaria mercenaria]|uniref:39S ribosomal protein L21, mitochondrial-like n=1 Tax=Mercenaria mercenaria TaxID=6596 RepID=UPI00234EF7F5|nr:39S ribosomal protein L21, mitochondrial-like [Mercenaria mercenaria]